LRLLERIEQVFSNYKDRPAFSYYIPPDSLRTVTYGQLEESVKRLAHFMLHHGMKPEDIVMCYMNKSIELVAAILATILNWGISCYLNPKHKPSQVLKLSSSVKPKFIILDKNTFIHIMKSKESVDRSNQFILYTGSSGSKAIDAFYNTATPSLHIQKYPPDKYDDIMPFTIARYDSYNHAFCLFTSGSTGIPKGVLISRDDLFQRANTEAEDYELKESDRLLSLVPFSFDVGLNQFFSCFLTGAHLIILNSWFPKDILTTTKSLHITGISGVPMIWVDMISYQQEPSFERDIQTLRYITVSGGDLAQNQLLQLRRYFKNVNIYKTYGQTETFRSSMLRPWDFERKMTSVGKPVRGTQVFILDENNKIAPPNTQGEIVHYGDGTMLGYLNDVEGTQEKLREVPDSLKDVLTEGKVVFTGDLGKMDNEGYLYILGREDGMIKTLGYRVYPKEVENYILEHERVKYAAVTGISNGRMGQMILAEVVPKGPLDAEELSAYLRHRLPSYMVPAGIYIVDSLPLTENRKINYSEIKRRHEERRLL